MDLRVSIPLDPDGFLDRQCPACQRRLRVDEPEDTVDVAEGATEFHCPYCGEAAGADQWWTREQLAYLESAAVDAALGPLIHQMATSDHIQVKAPGTPPPLTAGTMPMMTVSSPCHPDPAVKVTEDTLVLHCWTCGSKYRLLLGDPQAPTSTDVS